GQGLGGLPVGLPPVQQVAGEEHQAGLPLPGKLGQAGEELPLFPPPLGGLVRGQAGEGAVQVEVGPVNEFDHWVVSFPGGFASVRVLRRGFAACGRRVTFWTARKSPKNRRGTAQDEHEVLIFALPIPSGLRPSPLDKGSRPPVPRYRGRQLGDLGGYRKGAGSSADWFSLVFRCRSLGKGRELGTPLMESAFVAVGLKCGS